MRYLVTGGAGFIGSNTVDELVSRGHSVVVLDDLSSGKEDNLAEIRNKITFIKGSVTDIEVVRKAMHEAEYVLHLAARTSVPRSVKDPIETNKINIDGTLNVLVAAKELKIKRAYFALRRHQVRRGALRPDVWPVLRPGKRRAPVFQYLWTPPGSRFAVFRRACQVLYGIPGRYAAGCFRRRRTDARLHLRRERGAGQFTRLRSAECFRKSFQRRRGRTRLP